MLKITRNFILIFVLFLTCSNSCFAITMSAVTCGAATQVANWPRNVFQRSCSINISALKPNEKPGSLGVSLSSYNSTRTSGNGPATINVTAPENPVYRFQVIGDLQGGTPANITTEVSSATTTMITDKITLTGVYNFILLYTTYEADTGDTSYSQMVNVNYYTKKGSSYLATSSYNFTFTVANKGNVIISGPLSISLLPSQVQALGQIYDSNTVTISVYANNAWLLQTQISGQTGITNYFKASGTGFNNLASSRTGFLQNSTYYNIAQNSAGVFTTGSSNGINLNPVYVMLTYSYLNSSVLTAGTYIYNTILNVNSP